MSDFLEAYRDGYSVLPKLKPLDGPVFRQDEKYAYYIQEKEKAVENQLCFLEHDCSSEIDVTICDFIREQAEWTTAESFQDLAMQLQEDIAIHRVEDGRDWLAACHVCFPSGWEPLEKIGRPLREIHAPIPGMNLDASFKLAQTMVNHGPFKRYVWSVIHEHRINCHPRTPRAEFNLDLPKLYLKVEEQITWGFPELNAALFVLRQNVLHPGQIDLFALYNALKKMTPEQKAYKGISDDVILWIEKTWW